LIRWDDVSSFFALRNLLHQLIGAALGTAITRGSLWFARFEMDPTRDTVFWVAVPATFFVATGLALLSRKPRFEITIPTIHLLDTEGRAETTGGLVVRIVNSGADASVIEYSIRVLAAGAPTWKAAQLVYLDSAEVRRGKIGLRYPREAMLWQQTNKPIRRGTAVTGLLPFSVDVRFEDLDRPGTRYEVTVTDAFGGTTTGDDSVHDHQEGLGRHIGLEAQFTKSVEGDPDVESSDPEKTA